MTMIVHVICLLWLGAIVRPADFASLTPDIEEPQELIVDIRTAADCDAKEKTETGKTLTVSYEGFLGSTNVLFDSSKERNESMTFTLGSDEVIAGWNEGLLGMCPGDKRVLTVPPSLAYGDKGLEGIIPPGETLVFDILLLEVS